jgi:O-antigen ligase
VRRRSSALALIWILLANGTAMGLVAILQRFTGADGVLWLVASSNENFWGTFFYRNQGVAYLNLILTAAAALYFFHFNKAEERGQRGGPHLLLFVFTVLLATSVGLAVSRGGIIFGSLLLGVFLVLVSGRLLFSRSLRGSILLSLVIAGFFAGGSYYIARNIDWADIEERFGDFAETLDSAEDDSRAITTLATWRMAQERWVTGFGAGSFRYIFPMYQKDYPDIFYARFHGRRGWEGRRFFRYAHNDIVQFLAEYGAVGYGLLAFAGAWWLAVAGRCSEGNRLVALMLLAGVVAALAHAFLDFIFHSPTYLVAFFGTLALFARLLALEAERNRPAVNR